MKALLLSMSIMIKNTIYIITILLNISFSYTEISLGQGIFDNTTNQISFPLNYNTDSVIYGFQFTINYDNQILLLNQVSGGIIENENIDFDIWFSQNTGNVISFSENQNYIQSGSGILTNISFEITDFQQPTTNICITNPIFAGTPGETLDINEQTCIEYNLIVGPASNGRIDYISLCHPTC